MPEPYSQGQSPFGQKPKPAGGGGGPQGDPFSPTRVGQAGGAGKFANEQNMTPYGGTPPVRQGGMQPAGLPPMQATPDFAQRRANAQSLYGPGGAGWAGMGLTGAGGGGMVGGHDQQPPTRPMLPPPINGPYGPGQQGGQMGQRPMMPPGPPQQAGPGGMGQMAPQHMQMLQQLFSQPGFMQMLQRYMQSGQGGMMGQRQMQPGPPQPGSLPPAGGSGPYNPPTY